MYIENDKRNIEQDEEKEEKKISRNEINFYTTIRIIYIQKEFISLL